MDVDLYDQINQSPNEEFSESVLRKATLQKQVADYIVETLQPADRTVEELSAVIAALRSYGISDSKLSELMNLARFIIEKPSYVSLILGEGFPSEYLEKITEIIRYLKSEEPFDISLVKALHKLGDSSFKPEDSVQSDIKRSRQ